MGKRSKKRKGQFAKGPDARRHSFTADERRRGGITRGQQIIDVYCHYMDRGYFPALAIGAAHQKRRR